MKGLTINNSNTLNKYKLTININKRDVLAASISAADLVSISKSTAKLEITNNSNIHD